MARQSTPLTEKQRELARREAELEARMRHLQHVIEEAPKRKKEQIERRKQMLVERAGRIRGRSDLDMPRSLRGHTYRAHTTPSGPTLRSEQKFQRLQFQTLLVILAILTIYLLAKLGSL